MSRKPVPAQSGERSRVEVTFDKPQLLPQLFGEYDSNLLMLEERLGVYIHARGQRVLIEGSAEAVAHGRAWGPEDFRDAAGGHRFALPGDADHE